jgi:FtsP/CotA-like multicopper oxidase with cupredoxin domain
MKSKSVLVALLVGLAAIGSIPTAAGPNLALPEQACDAPDRTETLYAEHKNRYDIGYSRTPGRARIPGPIIEMTEGECLAITLVNNTEFKVSFHPHGVDYTVASDGSLLTGRACDPGGRAHTSSVRTRPTPEPTAPTIPEVRATGTTTTTALARRTDPAASIEACSAP